MEDKQIISQLKSLKSIKPNQDWVILTKQRIIGWDSIGHEHTLVGAVKGFIYQFRFSFASVLTIGIISGTVAMAQGALPGDILYPVKKTGEKIVAIATGKNKVPATNLALAEKRLDEINQLTQRNFTGSLAQAFKEYKSARTAAKREVAAEVKQNPAKVASIVKQVGAAIKNIDDKEKQVYGVLGLEQNAAATDEESISDKEIVKSLIEYFGRETALSIDQQNDLAKVKSIYDNGDYSQAMDCYLNSTLNK